MAGYVVVATDVTAEREAARLQDEFVSLVSHELRTPLTSVLGYLELLTDGTDPLTDEQREYLTVIDRNARRQLRLVGDLLLTAQVDAGTVLDLAAARRPRGRGPGVRHVGDTGGRGGAGRAGRRRRADGRRRRPGAAGAGRWTTSSRTRSSSRRPEDRSGCPSRRRSSARGSPSRTAGSASRPTSWSSLTTRFFRASTATRRAIPGVGLGLAITKAVVDAHGGTLSIASLVGEGTTFTIDLPATPPG